MFTAVAQKNLADAEGYFDEHLAQNDYYAAGEIRPGQWIGAGAERLGLKNAVTREQFHALCENQNPNDDKRLTQQQEKANQRRVFYDFTCSAPKSVSVLAVTMDDDRLVLAHEEATRVAFRELETFAATRVRKQGNQRDRTTGNLVATAFTHASSRALDPLLHTHLTVFNATFDETEKRWKAEQSGFAVIVIAERIGLNLVRVTVGKRMMPVIEVGAIPMDTMVIQPGGSKFSLKTLPEAAFGLRIDVDAFGDGRVHVNWSSLVFERSGCLKAGVWGNGANLDCGRLAGRCAAVEWGAAAVSSQCGLAIRFTLR